MNKSIINGVDFPEFSPIVGREELLQALHTMLFQQRKVALTGKSGMGKTTLAREYVRRYAQEYSLVCWLNMANDEMLLADLFSALEAFALPTELTQGVAGLFQRLQDYLAGKEHFLLVLDNPPPVFKGQDTSETQPMNGHLLVITPALSPSSQSPRLEITGLQAQEGALLVLQRAGLLADQETLDQAQEQQRQAALELAREFRGSPPGLCLAGSYMRETGLSVQDYLFTFRDFPARLQFSADLALEHATELAVAAELSLNYLKQVQSPDLALVQISALFLPEALPGAFFVRESRQNLSAEENKRSLSWTFTLSWMTSGLFCLDRETATLSMHPLIQDLVRQFFAPSRFEPQLEQACLLLQELLPSLSTEPLAKRLRVVGHIRHLAPIGKQWTSFSIPAADVFNWAASLLWEQGLIGTAEPLLRRAQIIWEQIHGQAHPGVATALDNLATMNSLLGNYVEAEALAHQAIASKSAALGINHPDVLLALTHLGQIYAAQSKHQEARLCYEKAFSIGDRVDLRSHPAYATARYALALLLIEQEQFEQAEPLLRKVCLIWEQNPGLSHPSTMAARFTLAEVSERLQQWERAEKSYRLALPVCEQLLGREHPVTLGHLERAALIYLRRNNPVEARSTLEQVVKTRERTQGSRHPDVAHCLNNLARVALAQEQISEAQALLERSRDIYEHQSEPDKLSLAAVLDTQASVEQERCQYEQAIAFSQRALELRRQVLGAQHLDLVENLSTLATLYVAQKQPQQAEALLLLALFLYQNAQKPEDLRLDPVLNTLAEIEQERQHFPQARMYLERVYAIREHSLGKSDPRTVEVRKKLTQLPSVSIVPEAKK